MREKMKMKEMKALSFTSQILVFFSNFVVVVWSTECPQFIALSGVSGSGNITSPGWPKPYPPDAICTYKLQGEPWQGVKITFHMFDLEPPYSAGCLNDYLELNTVDTRSQRTFRGRYCGKQSPAPILVLHPVVELVFRSNHAAHHSGFMATYEFVDEAFVKTPGLNATSPCGEVVQGIGGVITSPGYPRGYAAGLDCLWLIRVRYHHAIYLRVQHLEFQGSTANCQKAQLRIYDGYEHSLEDQAVLKKYCGDTRFYKGEDEKVLLFQRNRLLIRFTTMEPSKPVNDTDTLVGFKLVWSDVEFGTPSNCTKHSRFPCDEAEICFTEHHKGGTSSCPDLRNYCISSELVCDGIPHCSESADSSDERHCSRTPLVIKVVAAPLAILSMSLLVCFICFKNSNRKREAQAQAAALAKANHHPNSSLKDDKSEQNGGGSCCTNCCCCLLKPPSRRNQPSSDEKCHPSTFGEEESAPITRGPMYFKNDLESPGASDVVSPASGFSDTESELGNPAPIFCPTHGPVHYVPLRYLSRHFPLLPVVQEASNSYTPNADIYDEGGSLYSSQNSENMIIYEDKGTLAMSSSSSNHNHLQHPHHLHHHHFPLHIPPPISEDGMLIIEDSSGPHPSSVPPETSTKQATSTGLVNEWRLKQLRRVQRSDAVYMSDDNKSSIASSPGRICPRCLEKERLLNHSNEPILMMSTNSGKVLPSSTTSSLMMGHNSGVQFDSGIDVVDSIIEPVKNVSFETCTSSDSAISQGYRTRFFNQWKEKFCPPPMVEENTQTDPQPNSMRVTNGQGTNGHSQHHHHQHRHPHTHHLPQNEDNNDNDDEDAIMCETVTTFGVKSPNQGSQGQGQVCDGRIPCCLSGGPSNSTGVNSGTGVQSKSKATDV